MMKTDPYDPVVGVESGPNYPHGADGLTKREWFAGMAMQGLLAENSRPGEPFWWPDDLASKATKHADALIAALNEEPNER